MRQTLRWCLPVLAGAISALASGSAGAESVDVTVPAAVTFYVWNVNTATTGTPNLTTVSFTDADLLAGRALRISVKADAADFTPPSGTAIPASSVTWTTSNAQGGSGYNGTLSSTAYGQVYQSVTNPSSGSVDVTWSLAAPGAGIRAGSHTLTIRWKLESVAP